MTQMSYCNAYGHPSGPHDCSTFASTTVSVKWLQDRLANIEELHSVRTRTVDGATLKWCRECQQNWPCPTVELARG